MDRQTEQRKKDWSWLPEFMPGVSRLIKERRASMGDAWVQECWRRGVNEHQPGWFLAAEGSLVVGTPVGPDDMAEFLRVKAMGISTASYLYIKAKPERAAHGAN
jgi:hypothetical protein